MQPFAGSAQVSAQVVDDAAASCSGEVAMRSCGHGVCGDCMHNFIKARARSS